MRKTQIGYKLFEMDTKGNLHPLFIGKKESYPIGKVIKAKNIPTKGFAQRAGLHVGEFPAAPWLLSTDGTYKSQRSKYWKRVWCEVECNVTNNYQDEVMKLPKKCFTDKIPENGHYIFRECGKGNWIITSDIKINKILTEEERKVILNNIGYNETKEFEPYRKALEKKAVTLKKKKSIA